MENPLNKYGGPYEDTASLKTSFISNEEEK